MVRLKKTWIKIIVRLIFKIKHSNKSKKLRKIQKKTKREPV